MSGDGLLFSPAAVEAIERRFAIVPVFARPALWQHVTLPQYAKLRTWLERELGRPPGRVQRVFLSCLVDEERDTGALSELATGYVLRQPGYTVEYQAELQGSTADILVTDGTGRQIITEV